LGLTFQNHPSAWGNSLARLTDTGIALPADEKRTAPGRFDLDDLAAMSANIFPHIGRETICANSTTIRSSRGLPAKRVPPKKGKHGYNREIRRREKSNIPMGCFVVKAAN
jgi:hypothetical protein